MSRGRAYRATLAKDLVRVEVGEVSYALEIERIREIVHPLPIIALPRKRPFILGVADYRDQVAPVVDLRSFFELPPREPGRRAKWIILSSGDLSVAVVVDKVLDVFPSSATTPREVPALDDQQRAHGITSAYRYAGKLVFLLDADRLVEPAEGIPAAALPFLRPEAS